MRILVSACLLGAGCKYSGGDNADPRVIALKERFELVPVCPEQLGGLPTPRPCAERVGDRVMTETGMEVTPQFQKGAEETLRLAKLLDCQAALLKSRSPSCGSIEIYDGSFSHRRVLGQGVTAEKLVHTGIPVFDEEHLAVLECFDFSVKTEK